ncbi:MAG: hypothetical protein R3C97_00890 [Geminicoccaceae bacterium]
MVNRHPPILNDMTCYVLLSVMRYDLDTHVVVAALRSPKGASTVLVESAINGQAGALVTFNVRDFGQAPEPFGIALISPQEALRRIRT